MIDQNETLQACLIDIERGVPLEDVLNKLPAEALDLTPLIRLAAATRSVPHPVLRPDIAQVQKSRVERAAQLARTGGSRPAAWNWLAKPRNSLALAGAFALVLVVVAAAVGINMLLNAGQVAKLADVTGLVEVANSAESNDWHFVSAGESLQAGQLIRTYADSTLTLAYYEGSRTLVGPNSELVVAELARNGDALQVLLSQRAGMTSNAIVPLRGNGSYFNVDTPSGLVVVHGTSFDVDVTSGGEVLFAVTHGKVQITNDVSEVFLLSGQATTALPGVDFEKPGYQFTLTGKVESILGELWKVDGIAFSVMPATEILGSYQPGDAVRVKGRILETGQWVADRIEPAQTEQQKASFTGLIETMSEIPGTWMIGGQGVMVTKDTDLDERLEIGSPVKVTFVVQTDGWLAKEIELLEDERPEPTATPTNAETSGSKTPTATATLPPTATLTPTATETFTPSPSVTGTPSTETPIPTITYTPSVMPKNENSSCDNRTNIQPEGLRLSQRYQVSYEEIMDWFCKGFGFGEIDLAYELSKASGIPVSEIFRMRSDGMGWGNIKKAVSAQITPSPVIKDNEKPAPKPSHTPKPKK
jgi:hypothetical protein